MRNEGGPVRRLFRIGSRRPRPADEVDWEIEHYLAERTDRLVEEGWSPQDARREAERRFGPVERYRPQLTRIERRMMMMRTIGMLGETVGDGLRDTLRTVRRSPGFALAVVLTLGLGVGANAAMFRIVDRLLLRPPNHVEDAERLRRVTLTRYNATFGSWSQEALTFPDLVDLERAGGFEVAAYGYATELTMGGGPEAVSVEGRMVSHDFFRVLGASPVLGRVFTEDEDRIGAPATMVLSHELWTRRFGADPAVLGRSLKLSGDDYTVIGVAPAGFTGATLQPVDVWLPLQTGQALVTGSESWRDSRYYWWLTAVVRLNDDVALEAAGEEATALHRAGRAEMIDQGRYDDRARITLEPLVAAADTPEGRVAAWLLGVAFVVLLIACANVANLLLARGARRRRESAVRLAVGGSRRRLAAQRGVEAMGLALAGGALAVLLVGQGADVMARALLPDVLFPSVLSPRVLVFTVGVALLAGALAGLGPALQGGREGLAGSLAEGSRGSSLRRSRLRGTLAVAQAALSVVLLVGAGLFVRSLHQVRSLDLGMDVDRLALAELELEAEDPPTAERLELYTRAAERLRRLPGVTATALSHAPFRLAYAQPLRVPGVDSIPTMPGGGPYYFGVDPGYFATVGLEVLQGRGFDEGDRAGGAPVTVVSRSMADSLFDGSALGGCLMVGRDAETCTTVVGVVEEASRGDLETEPHFAYYLPIRQMEAAPRGIYVRVDDDPADRAGEIALALRSSSPGVRFARVQGLREMLDPQARSWTMGATMFTVFGLLALVVATVGLYSLLSFEVADRTREIGIRSALGAARAHLIRRVVTQGTRLVAAGLLLGLAAAWLAAGRVEGLLFGVGARDPLVLGGVAVVLLSVALVATLVPGWRAARVDPMVALRNE